MTTVNVNSVTINTTGNAGYSPFRAKTTINSVDLKYTPWTNNSMTSAFQACANLTYVTNINQNVTNMYYAFAGCTNLVNAPVIPNSVTNMYWAFGGCKNLVNAPVIGNSVTDMVGTFADCTN